MGEPGPYSGSFKFVHEGPNQAFLPAALVLKPELVDVLWHALVYHASSDFETILSMGIMRRLPLWQLFLLTRRGMYERKNNLGSD
jgi:hypothetical protein